MTQKEKAEEIYNYFKQNAVSRQAKDYAIFCCEQVINSIKPQTDFIHPIFWGEVKKEIEKL